MSIIVRNTVLVNKKCRIYVILSGGRKPGVEESVMSHGKGTDSSLRSE